jgi:alcohol dehydrogenase (cytochrome c)
MRSRHHSCLRFILLAGAALIGTAPTFAAEVTPARLANPEPGNWLMNHRTYDAQRYSPLDKINAGNVKSLKLAYAVAIGGTAINENLQATPLAEDGFLYITDQWGILYKIDARSGDAGRIVWRMDPKQEKAPLANRGAACGETSSSLSRAIRRGPSPPTRRPAPWSGRPICLMARRMCNSPPHRSP